MPAVRDDAVKHKVVSLFSRVGFRMPSVIQFICTCTAFRIQCSEKSAMPTCGFRSLLSDRVTLSTPKPMSSGKRLMILFQCQSMVSLIARQRLSMLLIWYGVVVREDDTGKGATRLRSHCSGLESAITTDRCLPIVVPHPPSRMFADHAKKRGRILRKSQEHGEPLGHRNPTAQATMNRGISSPSIYWAQVLYMAIDLLAAGEIGCDLSALILILCVIHLHMPAIVGNVFSPNSCSSDFPAFGWPSLSFATPSICLLSGVCYIENQKKQPECQCGDGSDMFNMRCCI